MTRRAIITHEFVEFIPGEMKDGTLYVSMEYATSAHLCPCGCRSKVITPITPTDWQLTFDGETVSLYPSIGNWSFQCQSHYWIRRNRVRWARQWSREEIETGRSHDRVLKERFFQPSVFPRDEVREPTVIATGTRNRSRRLWSVMRKLLRG